MEFTIDCTGDVVVGDTIRFTEACFSGGSFGRFRRPPTYQGDLTITAKVVKDSYGAAKQQHTFTLLLIESTSDCGWSAGTPGAKILRKGRNVYRNGVMRQPWADESARRVAADEKHVRGAIARADRQRRKESCDATA